MSRVQFQIGQSEHVKISLPSKQHGNCDLFMGKAILNVSRLSCSQDVSITRVELNRFFKQAKKVYDNLKGSFELESIDSRFKLRGTANSKGMICLNVIVTGFVFSQPDNIEWSASTSFTFYPEGLRQARLAAEREES